jgi:hypothetical protein
MGEGIRVTCAVAGRPQNTGFPGQGYYDPQEGWENEGGAGESPQKMMGTQRRSWVKIPTSNFSLTDPQGKVTTDKCDADQCHFL